VTFTHFPLVSFNKADFFLSESFSLSPKVRSVEMRMRQVFFIIFVGGGGDPAISFPSLEVLAQD